MHQKLNAKHLFYYQQSYSSIGVSLYVKTVNSKRNHVQGISTVMLPTNHPKTPGSSASFCPLTTVLRCQTNFSDCKFLLVLSFKCWCSIPTMKNIQIQGRSLCFRSILNQITFVCSNKQGQ